MNLLFAITCATVLTAASNVTVHPLQGESVRGELVSISDKGLTIKTAEGERSIDASSVQVVQVRPAAMRNPDRVGARIAVGLIDESYLIGSSVSLANGNITVSGAGQRETQIPVRMAQWIRFHGPDEAIDAQWEELIAATPPGDVLVVRKPAAGAEPGDTRGLVLDQLAGVIYAIGDATVGFEFDGDRLDVARTKLEGIIFRQQRAQPLADPVCRIEDTHGSSIEARGLKLEDGQLQLTSVAGVQVSWPLADVVKVDYSAANLVYLSDLKPERVEWQPYLRSSSTPSSVSKWFQPKKDQGMGGQPLTLNGQSYEKGLAVHSHTLMSYRLTKEYRQLVATVGVDARLRTTARLRLMVYGDERELFSREITGTDEPFDLELDMRGVRRLRIVVDFGSDRSDAGDLLYLCNARLMK